MQSLHSESNDYRPLLKIGPLTNLQDARSSAAVGFNLISFSLERGNMKKLPASLIWNITQWLNGPEIVLDLNRMSLPELDELEKSVSWSWLSFPYEDWTPELLKLQGKLIIKANDSHSPASLKALLETANRSTRRLWIELSLKPQQLETYTAILGDSFVHFPEIDQMQQFIGKNSYNPFGFCLGEEAEEEAGLLDYERIDELMEVYTDRFPE